MGPRGKSEVAASAIMEVNSASAASTGSWKVRTADNEHSVKYIPFDRARQFFAVDASGSTAGRIIGHERDFVEKLHAGHPNDKVTSWGSDCGVPTTDFSSVLWDRGGTQPSRILMTPTALDAIGASDLWYLLTDGEIYGDEVQVLCKLAMETGVLNVPVIFVITGRKGPTPDSLDVSVGISFFANATDVLILFKDVTTGHLYIIAGKGCFARLASSNGDSTPDLSSWTPLKRLFNEAEFMRLCASQDIQLPSAHSRPKILSGTVRLGEQWERENDDTVVDVELLFTSAGKLGHNDLEQLLSEDAFNNLSVACKTRGRSQDLRNFLISQKIEEINIKLEDISGASDIISQLGDAHLASATRESLQQQLRGAHNNNKRHYQDAIKNLKESGEHQAVHRRNRSVNSALEQLVELESSGYTADILSRRSNRARRAASVATGGEVNIGTLSLETPIAFRGECHICCGENEVMSIAIKVGADGAANTDNFALDFPLAAGRFKSNRDLVASQYVCFQCGLALNAMSLYREELAAVLPTLDYTKSNKQYMLEQLYVALTGGLKTGASGVSQLFMAILDGTLREKGWAGAGDDDSQDPEVTHRQAMLRWMLKNMLENTSCRETFNEQGEWVTYHKALIWAANDFRSQGVDSWIIGYPTAGFMQLVGFGQQLGAFDTKTIRDLRLAKVLYSVTSAYFALLFKNAQNQDHSWKQPLLENVYAQFNTTLVPLDVRGADSLVKSPATFWDRLAAFLTADTELLANWESHDQERAMRRVQLLAFWLIYHQKEHARAKTFFQKLRTEQPLSHNVLSAADSTLSPSVTDHILLSIFRGNPANPTFNARHTGLAPFTTPFGPSVLHCCFAACAEPFLSSDMLPGLDEPWSEKHRDALRQARAAHLVKAFAIDEEKFAREAPTGLPMVTMSPAPPSSTHCNVHANVARVWSRLNTEERRRLAIAIEGKKEVNGFVRAVVEEVCTRGRGDVFWDGLEGYIPQILPSFLEALRVALRSEGRTDEDDVATYEHDWTGNHLVDKARWEMRNLKKEMKVLELR